MGIETEQKHPKFTVKLTDKYRDVDYFIVQRDRTSQFFPTDDCFTASHNGYVAYDAGDKTFWQIMEESWYEDHLPMLTFYEYSAKCPHYTEAVPLRYIGFDTQHSWDNEISKSFEAVRKQCHEIIDSLKENT